MSLKSLNKDPSFSDHTGALGIFYYSIIMHVSQIDLNKAFMFWQHIRVLGYNLQLYAKNTNLRKRITVHNWFFFLTFPASFSAVPLVQIDIFFIFCYGFPNQQCNLEIIIANKICGNMPDFNINGLEFLCCSLGTKIRCVFKVGLNVLYVSMLLLWTINQRKSFIQRTFTWRF